MCFGLAVAGFGVDPALRISVLQDLKPGEQYEGVSQVQGFNDESRAFLFQGNTEACVLFISCFLSLSPELDRDILYLHSIKCIQSSVQSYKASKYQ